MKEIATKVTFEKSEFEQIKELERLASEPEDTLNVVLVDPRFESGSTTDDSYMDIVPKGQTVLACLFGQLVEIVPNPTMVDDFYERPHQEGIKHGPYIPLGNGASLMAESLHQLNQQSLSVGTAWFRRKISEESGNIIDEAIKREINKIMKKAV